MTESASPRLLPLHVPRGRSATTCLYRCGNACAHPAPNPSDNEYFGDLVTEAAASGLSRRNVLKLGLAGALTVGAATTLGRAAPASAAGTGIGFTPVAPNVLDAVVVPDGYAQRVLVRWGEPILRGAPAFDPRHQSPAAQAMQFGYNNDFVGILPLARDHALLVVNHEYTNEELMFPGWTGHENASDRQKLIAMMAHGISVVELERAGGGRWRLADPRRARHNRRVHLRTRFAFTGPAAGSSLLRTSADPAGRWAHGTLNNCSGGITPWGTMLSGEENFNQYFVGGDGVPAADKPALERYGIPTTTRYPDGSRRWETVDSRFDLSREPHEVNRFGWVVEVDPYDPHATPRKHTALGRFKHERARTSG